MKNALRNYLKEHDEVVAVYCKIASIYGQPVNDEYEVVFHQDGGGSFSIAEVFTEEELTKAKRYWKFVESWKEVKSMRDIHLVQASGCCPYLYNIGETVYKTWEMWEKEGRIHCKGPAD